jgi:hypothetical protein
VVVDPVEAHPQAGEYGTCAVVEVLHLDIVMEDE